MVLDYSGMDFNETVRNTIWMDLKPGQRNRRLTAAVIDTSFLVRRKGLTIVQKLQRRHIPTYVTQGVETEVKEIQKYAQRSKRGYNSDMDARADAARLVERLREEGRVLDVKTRGEQGDPKLTYENYNVLLPLSSTLEKTVFHDLVLERFDELYNEANTLYSRLECKRLRHGTEYEITNVVNAIVNGERIPRMYEGLRKPMEEITRALYKRVEEKIKEVDEAIPGSLDSEEYVARLEGSNAFKATSAIRKTLCNFLIHRVRENVETPNAKERYRTEKKNRGSTDRKVVLATYTILRAMYGGTGRIAVLSADHDITGLLYLRKLTTIDYTNFKEQAAK